MADYDVFKTGDKWVGKRENASRASVKADTQTDAYKQTRDLAERQGGGEVKLHGINGTIRGKNTIVPKKDPRRSKG